MSPIDEPWKHDEELLMQKARLLVGKGLFEIAESIKSIDDESRVTTKSGAAYALEEYFSIEKNSRGEPDFPDLHIELKSVPLKERNGMLTVKEPMSLNMINYGEEVDKEDISQSSLYQKNRRLLMVCYVHAGKRRSEYRIRYVFLWEMDHAVLDELRADYKAIIQKIRAGKAHELHQHENTYLSTCPKHNGDYSNPAERTSKAMQPCSPILAERRAYRLKNIYMDRVIAWQLGFQLGKNGRGTDPIWWPDKPQARRTEPS